jgi:hypothetical protein
MIHLYKNDAKINECAKLPNELAPRKMLYQLSCNKMHRPMLNCPPRKTRAWNGVTSLLARGLVLVRSTLLSISLSHMSFIVHPAPLITKAPERNRVISQGSGKAPGPVARAQLHPQGQKSSHVPVDKLILSRKFLHKFHH